MKDPIVLVNAKAYQRGVGTMSVKLAAACARFGAYLAVQAPDIYRVSSESEAIVWAQHVDPVSFGSHTGAVVPEVASAAGAVGSLINHAEKQLSITEITQCIARCKDVGMQTMVCVDSLSLAKQVDKLSPTFIALELPELIGGDVSIVSADPSLITDAVETLSTPVLVGAGVQSGEDLKKSLELGARGVLLASAVVKKSDSYEQALQSLYDGVTTMR